MSILTAITATDESDSELIDLAATAGVTIRKLELPGVSYRTKEVQFDDIPGTTVVQTVRAAQAIEFEVGADSTTFGGADALLATVSDAICDPDLRTWYLEFTYDSGRKEKWTCVRPCDMTPRDAQDGIASYLRATFRVTVQPTPTVTPA